MEVQQQQRTRVGRSAGDIAQGEVVPPWTEGTRRLHVLFLPLNYCDWTDDRNLCLEHGYERPGGPIGSGGIIHPVEFFGGEGHVDEFEEWPEEDAD